MSEESKIEVIIEPVNKKLIDWKELWEYRELFYFFTWRDIKVKYKQTTLGILWALLQPIFMVLIFSFFFGNRLQVPSDDLPYPVFAFSGLLLWNLFSSGVTNAGNSMVSNAHIIKKIYFPRLIIPFSAIISATVDFAIAFGVFLIMLLFFKTDVDMVSMFYCWPLSIIIAFVGTSGVGSLLSALNVKYRDFRYAIPFMIQALLFLTPVIYPVSMLQHQWIKYLLAINPIYAAISCFRIPLTPSSIDPTLFMISVGSGAVLFLSGILYFKRTEMYFADLA
jgi:lipopolysaccharide transport system permease protein